MLGPNLARRRRGLLLMAAASTSLAGTIARRIAARGDPSGVLRAVNVRNESLRVSDRSRALGLSPIPYV